MKKRSDITIKIRDQWVTDWKRKNSQDNGYFSFITTQDVKSEGAKNRCPDFETPHLDRNFLSANESFFYLYLLFDPRITAIKEQYPLLEVERTQYIAKELGLRHPTYPFSANVPVVMTSDFFCDTIFGKKVVYSVKDEMAFENDVLREKYVKNQKIEKAFWESCDVKWHLVRSKQIKTTYAENLEKIVVDLRLNSELQFLFNHWFKYVKTNWQELLIEPVISLFDKTVLLFGVNYEQATSLFQHAIWHRTIKADLSKKLNYCLSLSDLGASLNA
jgi:hypothetical protein